jgi:AcrR family transcriptional regulator
MARSKNADVASREPRERILEAAAKLVAEGGPEAATTRAVAAAASVQAPTLYRLFGDMRGLLDAVAEREIERYVSEKASKAPHPDPVEDLRAGWDVHIAFGLAHPGVFALMSGDPQTGTSSPAAKAGTEVLRRRVRRIAEAGRLRVPEEQAVALVHAIGMSLVRALLSQPAGKRDRALEELTREAIIASITGSPVTVRDGGPRGAAIALAAGLDRVDVLSASERALLGEWLERIAHAPDTPAAPDAARPRVAARTPRKPR